MTLYVFDDLETNVKGFLISDTLKSCIMIRFAGIYYLVWKRMKNRIYVTQQ